MKSFFRFFFFAVALLCSLLVTQVLAQNTFAPVPSNVSTAPNVFALKIMKNGVPVVGEQFSLVTKYNKRIDKRYTNENGIVTLQASKYEKIAGIDYANSTQGYWSFSAEKTNDGLTICDISKLKSLATEKIG